MQTLISVIGLIGFVGVPISIVVLVIQALMKRNIKNTLTALAVSFLMVVIAMIIPMEDTNNGNNISDIEYAMPLLEQDCKELGIVADEFLFSNIGSTKKATCKSIRKQQVESYSVAYVSYFKQKYKISLVDKTDKIEELDLLVDNIKCAEDITINNGNYISKEEFTYIVRMYLDNEIENITQEINRLVEENKQLEIEEQNRKLEEEARAEQELAEKKAAEAKIKEILKTKPEEYNINDIIQLYKKGDATYDILNGKHMKLTGYVKRTEITDNGAVVYVDSQNMQSFIGSKINFKEETNNDTIAQLKKGQKVVIDGIADTTNLTFQMYECSIVDIGGTDIDKSEFAKIDIDSMRRKPREWDGKLVKFTGTINQVMPVSLMSWHTRYVVTVGDDKVSFYIDSDTNYLEGDKVTVYGTSKGLVKVTNIFGVSTSIPDIKAIKVEVK